MKIKNLLVSCILLALPVCANAQQWSIEKADEWAESNPWFCGVNYIPANALNYTAMWDQDRNGVDEYIGLVIHKGVDLK